MASEFNFDTSTCNYCTGIGIGSHAKDCYNRDVEGSLTWVRAQIKKSINNIQDNMAVPLSPSNQAVILSPLLQSELSRLKTILDAIDNELIRQFSQNQKTEKDTASERFTKISNLMEDDLSFVKYDRTKK